MISNMISNIYNIDIINIILLLRYFSSSTSVISTTNRRSLLSAVDGTMEHYRDFMPGLIWDFVCMSICSSALQLSHG